MILSISIKQVLIDRYKGKKQILVIWNYDIRLLKKFLRDLEETYKVKFKIQNTLNDIIEIQISKEFNLKDIEKQMKKLRFTYEIFI